MEHGSDLMDNKCICEKINDGKRCTRRDFILAVIFPAKPEFTSIIEMLRRHIFFDNWFFNLGISVYGLSRATEQIDSAEFEKRLVNILLS